MRSHHGKVSVTQGCVENSQCLLMQKSSDDCTVSEKYSVQRKRYSYSRRLLRTIASRVRDELDSSSKTAAAEHSRSNVNLKTVAIMPVSRNVPIDAFARKLHTALEAVGAPTSYLNQGSVSDHLGRHAFTRMGKLKAAGWLAEQEQKYRLVLYVADSAVSSAWTQTCIRQVMLCYLFYLSVLMGVPRRRTTSWSLAWATILALVNTSVCCSR